jgi:hypothetical protein
MRAIPPPLPEYGRQKKMRAEQALTDESGVAASSL